MRNPFEVFNRLFDLTDINGKKPLVRILEGNRTGMKTTTINTILLRKFKKEGKTTTVVVPFVNDMDDIAGPFFSDVKEIYKDFKNDEFTQKMAKGNLYGELFLNDDQFGYIININRASKIKRKSNIINKTNYMLIDEFQAEDYSYPPNCIEKFTSLIISAARGHDENGNRLTVRPDFEVIMISNSVDPANPYYRALNIRPEVLYNSKGVIKGDGWVLLKDFDPEAAERMMEEIPFKTSYLDSAADGKYMVDRQKYFVHMDTDSSMYLCTLIYKNKLFGLYMCDGFFYFRKNGDKDYSSFVVDIESMKPGRNFIPANTKQEIIKYFYRGQVCCDSAEAQECMEFVVGI